MKTLEASAFEGLQKALDADPDDTVTRQALADWYEEMGDGPRAEFHRALAQFQKRPMRLMDLEIYDSSRTSGWCWWSSGPAIGRPSYLGHVNITWIAWNREGNPTRHEAEESLFAIWPQHGKRILDNWRDERLWLKFNGTGSS